MTQFKVGDTVRVTDSGRGFSTYREWATSNGLKYFIDGCETPDNIEAKVVVVGQHKSSHYGTILGIRTKANRDYIIEADAVELIEAATESPYYLAKQELNSAAEAYRSANKRWEAALAALGAAVLLEGE